MTLSRNNNFQFLIFNFQLLVIIVITSYQACFSQPSQKEKLYEVEASKMQMGTIVEAKVISENINAARVALYKAFREIERIDSMCSLQNPKSELNAININSGIKPVKISYELFRILQRSIEYSKKYEGLFDITIGPLTELWGFSSNKQIVIPGESDIKQLLQFVDYNKIQLNLEDTTVYLSLKGMILDLGGIAKGYAVDRAAQILQGFGYENFMLNAGGDVRCFGKNKYGKDWVVGIKHPRDEEKLLGKFHATNISIATSGDYERYIDTNGIRYHHILEPRTGMPGNKCRSVTVLYDNCEEATVLAKYIFLLGWEKFKLNELSKRIKWVVVESVGAVRISPEIIEENHYQDDD